MGITAICLGWARAELNSGQNITVKDDVVSAGLGALVGSVTLEGNSRVCFLYELSTDLILICFGLAGFQADRITNGLIPLLLEHQNDMLRSQREVSIEG